MSGCHVGDEGKHGGDNKLVKSIQNESYKLRLLLMSSNVHQKTRQKMGIINNCDSITHMNN